MLLTDFTFNTNIRWPGSVGTEKVRLESVFRSSMVAVRAVVCDVVIANEQHKQYPSDLGMT